LIDKGGNVSTEITFFFIATRMNQIFSW